MPFAFLPPCPPALCVCVRTRTRAGMRPVILDASERLSHGITEESRGWLAGGAGGDQGVAQGTGKIGTKREPGFGQPHPGMAHKGSGDLPPGFQGRAQGPWKMGQRLGLWGWGPGLTSMRKSPIRSPARHATPPSSTDSRYCSAGKAGVGVNSSMGVCAADGEEPAGSEGRGWRGRAGDGAQTQVTEASP